jgi:hypothetical protein
MAASCKLQDGQIYRWTHRDPSRSYWCKSRIAVVKSGRLLDTYWHDLHSEDPIRAEEVDLTLLCDQSWPTIRDWEIEYYDACDVVDTRHSNNSSAPVYLRPGAQKSPTAILVAIEAREREANSEIRMAEDRLKRLAKARALLTAGNIQEISL